MGAGFVPASDYVMYLFFCLLQLLHSGCEGSLCPLLETAEKALNFIFHTKCLSLQVGSRPQFNAGNFL